jgi:hypothetical protein
MRFNPFSIWSIPIAFKTARVVELVQRGTIAFAAESSKTATITTADTSRSELTHLGAEGSSFDTATIRLAFTNATTITATRQATGSSATVGFQVVTRP